MDKETYIYKKIEDITKSSSFKNKLNNIAKFIYEKYNTKIIFCKVFGNRRSFYAGVDNLLIAENHIKLTDEFELIVENNNIDEHTWKNLISDIQKLIIDEKL